MVKIIFLAVVLGFAVVLSSCATAAALADAAVAETVKAATKDSSKPTEPAQQSNDSSKPAEPAQQSNVNNNTINNSPVINNNNNPVINNSQSTVVNTNINIHGVPQGTKVEQGENGDINVQIPDVPQQDRAQIGKGIYVESNNDDFSSKISELISKEGCAIVNAENPAITLKIVSEYDEQPYEKHAVCRYKAKLELQNNKTGQSKSFFSDATKTFPTTDMKRACKEAMEKAVPEAWEKIKMEITEISNRGECK